MGTTAAPHPIPPRANPGAPRRAAGQVLACGWCGEPITVRATGRTPKWCSGTCRHRAWEQNRAAASGRSAVCVIDRQVQVHVPVTIVRTETVEVTANPKGAGWVPALHELARQLDTGRVYDRDLPTLTDALSEVLKALNRRPVQRHRPPRLVTPTRFTC